MRSFKKIAERSDTSPAAGESKYGDVSFADAKNKKYPIDTKAHVRNALSRWGDKSNRDKYSAEDQKTIGRKIRAAARRMGIGGVTEKAMLRGDFAKGLYEVGRLAEMLQSLAWLKEAAQNEKEREGDDSEVPDQLCDAISELGDALKAMTGEEVDELMRQIGADIDEDEEDEDDDLDDDEFETTKNSGSTSMDDKEKGGDQFAKKASKAHIAKIEAVHENAKAAHAAMGECYKAMGKVHKLFGEHVDKLEGLKAEVGGMSTTKEGSDEGEGVSDSDKGEKVAAPKGGSDDFSKLTARLDQMEERTKAAEKRATDAEAQAAEFKKIAEDLATTTDSLLSQLQGDGPALRDVGKEEDVEKTAGNKKEKDEPPKTARAAFKRSFAKPEISTGLPADALSRIG